MLLSLLASLALPAPAVQSKINHAIAFTYGGAVDTDVRFSEFWKDDFTLVVRFMEQFPYAYAGPILATEGAGDFMLGQGDYFWKAGKGSVSSGWAWDPPKDNKAKSPKLFALIAGQIVVVDASTLKAGEWNQLALVKTGSKCQIVLNGKPMGSTVPAGSAPAGTVRVGRPGTGKTMFDSRFGQFYGLVDDVAIVTRALSAADLTTGPYAVGAANDGRLGGFEPDLLAGFSFDAREKNGRPLPGRLNREAKPLNAQARPVQVAFKRTDAFDRNFMEPFSTPNRMILPIPKDQEWTVAQSYADGVGSHNGYAAFCLDLYRADGTLGKPVVAAGTGYVTAVREDNKTGTDKGNGVVVRHSPGFWGLYTHLQEGSFSKEYQAGAWAKANTKNGVAAYPMGADFHKDALLVKAGDPLARMSDTGAPKGSYHLHFAVSDQPDLSNFPGLKQSSFNTIPVAYRDYEVKKGGSWTKVKSGFPAPGSVVRRTVD